MSEETNKIQEASAAIMRVFSDRHLNTEEAIEALHLRAPDYDVQLRAVFAMVVGLVLLDPWIMPKPPRRPSRARIIDEMVATVLHGLLMSDLLPAEV